MSSQAKNDADTSSTYFVTAFLNLAQRAAILLLPKTQLVNTWLFKSRKIPAIPQQSKHSAHRLSSPGAVHHSIDNNTVTDASNYPVFTLPTLPYAFSALEPVIDTKAVKLHYDTFHATCVYELNFALSATSGLQGRSVEWLLMNLQEIPVRVRAQVRDNAAGHLNHCIMWLSMTPNNRSDDSENTPHGLLADTIAQVFGSFYRFKMKFEAASNQITGSGWVWLVINRSGALQIMTTAGQRNPIMEGCEPLLVADMWEHAYIFSYLERHDDYVHAWWSLVNWNEVQARFEDVNEARLVHERNVN